MDDILEPLAVLVPVFGGILLFTKILTDYSLRKKLINNGLVSEDAKNFLTNEQRSGKYGSLKWGIIVVAAGAGLISMSYVPYNKESLAVGVLALFIGVGLLIYYGMVKNKLD